MRRDKKPRPHSQFSLESSPRAPLFFLSFLSPPSLPKYIINKNNILRGGLQSPKGGFQEGPLNDKFASLPKKDVICCSIKTSDGFKRRLPSELLKCSSRILGNDFGIKFSSMVSYIQALQTQWWWKSSSWWKSPVVCIKGQPRFKYQLTLYSRLPITRTRGVNRFADRWIWPWKAHGLRILVIN